MKNSDLLERDEALIALNDALARARDGRGRTVAVTGEAGIGKTSLLNAFVDENQRDAIIAWGHCEPLQTARALGPLSDFAHELGSAVVHALRQQESAVQVFEAIFESVRTSVRPIIMVLEDVHWADEGTLDFVRFIARRVGRLPLCLVLSFRSDEVGPEHPLRLTLGDIPGENLRRVLLAPLSIAAVAALAQRSAREVEPLYRATAGNPFYLTEALANSEQQLPHSVRDAVLARLSRLDANTRAIMNVVSVSPGRLERTLVCDIAGDGAESHIQRCVQLGLLVETDERKWLKFRHEIARLATESALSSEQRVAFNQSLLQARLQAPDGDIARTLHHAVMVGDRARVLTLARDAAQHASRLGAHKEAARHYQTALDVAQTASVAERAALLTSWSYVAGLIKIDDAVIDARHRAIALWREVGNAEQVALNLRWLSRLHWYRGERAKADEFIDASVLALIQANDSEEKAWGLAVRAQMHMLRGNNRDAVQWGQRAIAMADAVNSTEVRVHAMNSVGCGELFGGFGNGLPLLEESLKASIAHRHHEQAARAYTNIASWAVEQRELKIAERFAREGLAFDQNHDLDSWTHYLEGVYGQVLLQLGRLDEAAEVAQSALDVPDLTQIMRMPALNVLAAVAIRCGHADARARVDEALQLALATNEAQRICPALFLAGEFAWVNNDASYFQSATAALGHDVIEAMSAWQASEYHVWAQRVGVAVTCVNPDNAPEPFQRERAGDFLGAAQAWARVGEPFHEAIALSLSGEEHLAGAVERLDAMGASAAANKLRDLARERGVRGVKRGPYASTRSNAFGLSAKEMDVLNLMAKGKSNPEIAEELFRSVKTVEHHASAVLSKLGTKSRMEAAKKARETGLLVDSD